MHRLMFLIAITAFFSLTRCVSLRAYVKPPASQPTTAKTDNRAAIVDEIKTDQEAIKSIEDEITGFDKDAADAEALAKNPPANIADADKPAYIDQKKNDEQAAQDSAKDARERLKEVQKNLDDAKTRLAALMTDEAKHVR